MVAKITMPDIITIIEDLITIITEDHIITEDLAIIIGDLVSGVGAIMEITKEDSGQGVRVEDGAVGKNWALFEYSKGFILQKDIKID